MSNIKSSHIPDFINPADAQPVQAVEPQAVTPRQLDSIKQPVSPVPVAVEEKPKALTQQEMDLEATRIRFETEKLRLRREQLELVKLEDDVRRIEQTLQDKRLSQETVQSALKYETERQVQHETQCTHMKGGESESMLGNAPSQGNDSANYCFIDHTFSTGVRFRMCQRCGKTYFPKDDDYKWAMTRPTRNSRSIAAGGAGMVQDWTKVQIKSSVPHRGKQVQEFGNFD